MQSVRVGRHGEPSQLQELDPLTLARRAVAQVAQLLRRTSARHSGDGGGCDRVSLAGELDAGAPRWTR